MRSISASLLILAAVCLLQLACSRANSAGNKSSVHTIAAKLKFKVGDRVLITEKSYWAKGALATIAIIPDAVSNLGGSDWVDGIATLEARPWGKSRVYWMNFDEPQLEFGDGPYASGSIEEEFLELAPTTSGKI